MKCKICDARRPRRACPGVNGDICTVCCGAEREVSVNCPLDCTYLREARLHEKDPDVDPATFPHADIRVTETFIRQNDTLLNFTASAVMQAGLGVPGAVDYDVRDAVESLVRTFRTLESGLYYESRPSNMVAAAIYDHVRQNIDQFRKEAAEKLGMTTVRDADILGVLVFLQRLEIQKNNGRRKGRAFLDFLRSFFGAAAGMTGPVAPTAPGSSLLLP